MHMPELEIPGCGWEIQGKGEGGEGEKYCYAEEGMHIHNDLGKDIQVLRIQV
jgi:hypothetical protein